ncbi:MAG: DUF2007 domain-containing protein [Caldilineaceae bacterium]
MSVFADGFRGWLRRGDADDAATGETESAGATRTGGSGEQEPVVVWQAANLMEAHVVKGRLVSEGIPAIVSGESLGRIYGLTAGRLASTDVLVPALLADKARQILETEVEWIDEEELDEQ